MLKAVVSYFCLKLYRQIQIQIHNARVAIINEGILGVFEGNEDFRKLLAINIIQFIFIVCVVFCYSIFTHN